MEVLNGIRVIDMTHMIAGPYATALLAHFGADVIKVESKEHPDGFRFREGRHQLMSRSFSDFNRGKRGICLDLGDPEGRGRLVRLAEQSDVLVENFSAGVLEKWNLTYPRLAAVNPRLVMISMQGLGRTGPHRDYVTWGPSLLSLTGFTYLWNHPEMPAPVGSQTAHPDYISGAAGAVAVMAGLIQRERTGRGLWMDLAQVEALGSLLGPVYLACLMNGARPEPWGNRRPERSPWNCYPCRGEDAWCMITVETEPQWRALQSVVGPDGGLDDPRFAGPEGRLEHRELLDARISAWTRTHAPEEVMSLCQAAGVPAGIVATGEQLHRDPQLRFRNFITPVRNPGFRDIDFPGIPFLLSRTPGCAARRPPFLCEHTEDVMELVQGEAGLSDAGGAA